MRLGCCRLTLWIINMNYWLILVALTLLGAKWEPNLRLNVVKLHYVSEVSRDRKDKGLGLVCCYLLLRGSVCRWCQSESHYCRGHGRTAPGRPSLNGHSCQGKSTSTSPALYISRRSVIGNIFNQCNRFLKIVTKLNVAFLQSSKLSS